MSDHLIAEANRHARALTIERDQIRTELALLREWQREVIQNANAHHAELKEAIARAERAESELAGIRALADRRNERDHSQDTTHQLVAALDQALEIAQAELATEPLDNPIPVDPIDECQRLGTELAEITERALSAQNMLGECLTELKAQSFSRGEKFNREAATELAASVDAFLLSPVPLTTERARYSALRRAVLNVLCDPEGKACFHGTDADRAAIDAAMREDAT